MESTPRSRVPLILAALFVLAAIAAGAGLVFFHDRRAGPSGGGALEARIAELRANPDDRALREEVVRLADRSGTPPVPEEARAHLAEGRRLFEAAGTIEDIGRAVEEYEAAARAAPWWAEANRDLGLALEAAQRHEEALAALRLCLASNPAEDEARAVREELVRIEGLLRRAAAPGAGAVVDCELSVPALVADYWVYVDGRLVDAPPHEGVGGFTIITLHDGAGSVFMDNDGVAVRAAADGRLTFVRGDVRDRAYAKRALALEPGTHRFEMLLLSAGEFPLKISSREVELRAGQAAEVSLDLPAGYAYGPKASAIYALPREDWQAQLERTQAVLKGRIAGLAADPVARALAEALAGLRLAAPERPVVRVELPADRGGARELDERQVSAVLRYLQEQYKLYDGMLSAPADAPGDYRNAMARLAPLLRAHNARLEELEEIGRILERVPDREIAWP